jgi:putative copper export protein/mono/diheme cytochrome c family protein
MESLIGFTQAVVLMGQAVLVGACLIGRMVPVDALQGTARRLELMARLAGLVALSLLVLLYVLRAGVMLDLPLSAVCTSDGGLLMLGTRVGQTLELAFALTALAVILCWRKHRLPAAVVGLGAIATAIAADHVAAQSLGPAALVAMALHVLLATTWFGCLPALLLLARNDSETSFKTLRQFSRLALPSMAVILASGAWIAVETIGSWPLLFATRYGLILIVKLVCTVVTLAAAFGLLRELTAAVTRTARAMPGRLLIAIEVGSATTVVLAAAILAQHIPTLHEAILWPYSFRIAPAIGLQTNPEKLWTIAAVLLAAFALLGAGWALQRKGQTALAALTALAAIGDLVVWGVPALSVPAYPTTYVRPAKPYSAHVIAGGDAIYTRHCAVCHGRNGHGDGPAAYGMRPPPADLTQAHTTYHTMGDMYWWVSHGFPDSAMPGFADTLSDDDRWAVITYVMALSLGYQARLLGPAVVPGQPWLHAIEFSPAGGEASVPFLATTKGRVRLLTLVSGCGTALDELRQAWSSADAWNGSDSLLVRSVIDPQRCGVPTSSIRLASLQTPSDAATEIASSWSLYRRSLSHADLGDAATPPEALVFLIDRFGFVRARWRSDEEPWPPKPADVIAQARLLADEPEINRKGVHEH